MRVSRGDERVDDAKRVRSDRVEIIGAIVAARARLDGVLRSWGEFDMSRG